MAGGTYIGLSVETIECDEISQKRSGSGDAAKSISMSKIRGTTVKSFFSLSAGALQKWAYLVFL